MADGRLIQKNFYTKIARRHGKGKKKSREEHQAGVLFRNVK